MLQSLEVKTRWTNVKWLEIPTTMRTMFGAGCRWFDRSTILADKSKNRTHFRARLVLPSDQFSLWTNGGKALENKKVREREREREK